MRCIFHIYVELIDSALEGSEVSFKLLYEQNLKTVFIKHFSQNFRSTFTIIKNIFMYVYLGNSSVAVITTYLYMMTTKLSGWQRSYIWWQLMTKFFVFNSYLLFVQNKIQQPFIHTYLNLLFIYFYISEKRSQEVIFEDIRHICK